MENTVRKRWAKDLITDKLMAQKAKLRISIYAVFLFVLLLSMSACSLFKSDDFNYDYIFDDVGELSTTAVTTAQNCDYYDVIVPSDCSGEVYDAADKLCKRIELKPTAKADVYYDYEAEANNKGHTYIYVGVLDNDICRRAYIDFRSDDYRYSFINEVFVVGGVTDKATVAAIERFIADIVDRSSDKLVMSDPEGFLYRADHTDDGGVLLNGFALSQYRIVYPVGDAEGMLLANELKNNIERQFGYSLSVVSDSDGDPRSRSICIGRTMRADTHGYVCSETQGVIMPYATGISIVADNIFGLKLGMAEFAEILSDGKDDGAQIKETITADYNKGAVSLINLYFYENKYDVQKILSVCDTVRNSDTDIIRFEGISKEFFEYVRKNLVNEFYHLEVSFENRGSVYYLCRKDNVKTDTKTLKTEESALFMIEAEALRNNLKFTFSELYAGKDASEIGEKLLADGAERMIAFGSFGNYENDFLNGVKELKKIYPDGIKLSVFADADSVFLDDFVFSKNEIFESSRLDFKMFYE